MSNRVLLPTFLRIRTWVYLLFWLPACSFLSIFSFPRVLCFPLCAVVVLLSINLPQALSCATTHPSFPAPATMTVNGEEGKRQFSFPFLDVSLPPFSTLREA